MPEGMVVNETALAAFSPLAKEMNLTQDQAQKLVNIQTEQIAAAEAAQVEQWQTTQDEWRETSKNDPLIGGTNFQATMGHVKTFLNKFANPAMLELLDDTGVGNNVEVIRLFAAAGKAMGEGNIAPGNPAPPGGQLTQAQILYPDQKP